MLNKYCFTTKFRSCISKCTFSEERDVINDNILENEMNFYISFSFIVMKFGFEISSKFYIYHTLTYYIVCQWMSGCLGDILEYIVLK